MFKHETLVRVRYKDTDQMGVVYHANYLVWFEIGRTEYFRRLGIPYSEFEKNRLYLPVIRVYCEYKSPARYDDEITILTSLGEMQEVRLVFQYQIFRGEELLATGSTEHAFVNQKGRPVALRKHSPCLWQRVREALGEDGGKP